MPSAAKTRRETWTFLALLLLASGVFYALAFLVPDAPRQWGRYALGFMWCPGLAALVTTFAWNRTLRGLGWGLGGTRHLLIAYGIALAAACSRTWSSGRGWMRSKEASSSRRSPGAECLPPCAGQSGSPR